MKNTKILFYCTHFQYGKFEKVIFEVILIGRQFNNLQDVKNWLNDSTVEAIYREFNFDLVFDWVILNYKSTSDPYHEIKIIETIEGKLSFPKKIKKEKTKILYDIETNVSLSSVVTRSEFKPVSKYFLTEAELLEKRNNWDRQEALITATQVKPKKAYKSVWINPSGKSFNIGFACHEEFASRWLERHDPEAYKATMAAFSKYSYETLEEKGWLRILGWADPPNFCLPARIGPKLKQSLREYCMSNDVAYNDWPEILKS